MTPDTGSTSAAEQFAQRRQSPFQRLQQVLHQHPAISPAAVLIISVVVFSLLNDRFTNPVTLSLVLQQVAIIAALAVGQTLIILTAGIDLSVGAVCILAMMVMAKLSSEHVVPPILAIVLGIAVGTAAGAVNGALVTRLSLPPFIVTLGTLSIFTALSLLYTHGKAILATEMPDAMSWAGTTFSIGAYRLTTGVIIVVVLYVVVHYMLTQTAWGRHVYAVGDDREGARLAGIRVRAVLMSVYAFSGLIGGLTAWVLIGRAGTASTNAIVDANLQSITAVVIGGTSLFGGRGAVIGTAFGALIVGVFQSGLSLAGVDDQWRVLAIGILVISAVSIDQWIRKVKA